MGRRALLVGWAWAVVLCAAATAQMPRVSAFVHRDSLALGIDCEPLLTEERIARLDAGYPLSFVLDLRLMRRDPVWFDVCLARRQARFRILRLRWEGGYALELSDLHGAAAAVEIERIEDLLLALEERLFSLWMPLADLQPRGRYHVACGVDYRNLTFADVQSVERWLREGRSGADSLTVVGALSLGERALGLLWDLAGLKGEQGSATAIRFRPDQLRRLE